MDDRDGYLPGTTIYDLEAMRGQEINHLTILGEAPKNPSDRRRRALVRCRCGTETDVSLYHLLRGVTQTCGCASRAGKRRPWTPAQESVGKEYGRLTVLAIVGCVGGGAIVRARCSCNGNEGEYRLSNIRRGGTKSCGCKTGEAIVRATTHGLSGTPIYHAWLSLKNVKSICPEWLDSFERFHADVGDMPVSENPEDPYRVRRPDKSRPLGPDNFQWVAGSEAFLLREGHRTMITLPDGSKLPLSVALEASGVSRQLYSLRVKRGVNRDVSATAPPKQYRNKIGFARMSAERRREVASMGRAARGPQPLFSRANPVPAEEVPLRPGEEFEFDGKKMTLSAWGEHLGLSTETLRHRLSQRLPYERVFSPKKSKRGRPLGRATAEYEYDGKKMRVSEWARHLNVPVSRINSRLAKKMPYEQVFTTGELKRGRRPKEQASK